MSLPETPAADWIDTLDALQAWLATIPADAAVGLDCDAEHRLGSVAPFIRGTNG